MNEAISETEQRRMREDQRKEALLSLFLKQCDPHIETFYDGFQLSVFQYDSRFKGTNNGGNI